MKDKLTTRLNSIPGYENYTNQSVYNLVKNTAEVLLQKNGYLCYLDDLVQESAIKVVAGIDSFNPEKGKLTTWISTIVRNELFDMLKTESKYAYEPIDYYSDDNENRYINRETDAKMAYYSQMEDIEKEYKVCLLKKESEKWNEAGKKELDLYLRGYSSPEIAQMFGTTKNAVDIRRHRTVKRIMEFVDSIEAA